LGNMFGAIAEDQAEATLEAAWECGIRYFDTAPHYGAGLSEQRFGHALRRRPRDSFVLSTKVGRVLSLQRMGLARIDIVYIHDMAEDAHGAGWRDLLRDALLGAGCALTRMRDEGLIRAWGLGVNRVEACEAALEMGDPDIFLIAGRYSLLDRTAAHALFPLCQRRGVEVVVGGPFNSGLLAGGTNFDYADAPTEIAAKRDRLRVICERHHVDLRAAALQFCAAHPVVSAVIPGSKDPVKVRQNAGFMAASIPSDLWADLRAEGFLTEEVISREGVP
jgi:D-threo-aldose 1-dehydrogenase